MLVAAIDLKSEDHAVDLDELKTKLRVVGSLYDDREARARRIFMEERARILVNEREREFNIRTSVSQNFNVPYGSVAFTGSAQLGFSIHKDRLFQPGISDLDVACIDANLFQKAWKDVNSSSKSFNDYTVFPSGVNVRTFKDMLVKRGIIIIDKMPISELSREWKVYQNKISIDHSSIFKRISIAIYINDYAFCWKQDSSLSSLIG